jgi:hypothetical protein
MFIMSGSKPWFSLGAILGWSWACRVVPVNFRAVDDSASNGRAARNDPLRRLAACTLERRSANADLCDWAERYLCGFTDASPEKFMEHRRAQA